MASRPLTSETANPSTIAENFSPHPVSRRHGMSTRHRLLFFVTAWLIVLMPFLFWWSTWFGRHLSDTQITEYLNDDKHPRHIQHALVQLGERMARQDAGATRWYTQLLRLAAHPVEEVRNTDAWVMGQDTSAPAFHETLLKMLQDSSPMVRGNAALSLVRFRDAAGRPQIVALLQPAVLVAPVAGRVTDIDKIGTSVRQGGLIAKLDDGTRTTEIRSPISGRIRAVSVATGANIAGGTEVATIDPSSEQVWEALRALYLVGQPGDLPAIRIYERNVPEIPDHLRKQAVLTEESIQARATRQP
jgi:biotin carboxyl carrier protein